MYRVVVENKDQDIALALALDTVHKEVDELDGAESSSTKD